MQSETEEVVTDPLTDTQRKLKAIVVEAVRQALAEQDSKRSIVDDIMLTLIDAFGKFYEALKGGWKAVREKRNKI